MVGSRYQAMGIAVGALKRTEGIEGEHINDDAMDFKPIFLINNQQKLPKNYNTMIGKHS